MISSHMYRDTEYTYDVYLRDTRNGKTKKHISKKYPMTPQDFEFYWTEGNNSCDCNRSIYIYGYENKNCLECNSADNIISVDKIVIRETQEILLENA